MRPVEKSNRINQVSGTLLEVNPWGDAKEELVKELGSYCSFCEKYNSRSALHVEHILGKNSKDVAGNLLYDHLKYRWDNFLLACVNCNSAKGNKDVNVLNPYMPHLHNILHYVEILTGGLMQVKQGIADADRQRVQAFFDLVGLDRVPGDPDFSDRDDRWENRIKVYDIAIRQRLKYTEPVKRTDIETIVDLARTNGYFSIWYSVFNAFEEVKIALIFGVPNGFEPFPGTHHGSFDVYRQYETIVR